MILDKSWEFSSAQAVQQNGAIAYSTNMVDVKGCRMVGESQDVLITIDETYADGTSVQFDLFDNTAESTSGGAVIATGGVKTIATLKAGYQFRIPVPKTTRRYLYMGYTTVGDPTAGKISAILVEQAQTNNAAANVLLNSLT